MYKSKLQELCHKKKWGLPKYTTVKIGPEHIPSFKSTATIFGRCFHSPIACRSSKEAQNEAAKLAFLHFSRLLPPSTPTGGLGEKEATLFKEEPTSGETKMIPSHNPPENNPNRLIVADDMKSQYKNQLQKYAQMKGLDLPVYASRQEGPFHAPRFTATVLVDGQTFESPGCFSTLKEAEHAAAKVALLSLPSDPSHKSYSTCYKNLLQELAQRRAFGIPRYKTVVTGAAHMPRFVSIVHVNGEVFCGKEGTSKKQAELDAAKVAYSNLVELELSQSAKPTSPDLVKEEAPKSIPTSDMIMISNSSQNLDQEVTVASQNGDFSSSSSESAYFLPEVPSAVSPIFELSPTSSSDSLPVIENDGGTASYLLGSRVKVYSCFPDITFPEGITLLPVGDDKWVPVNIEFQNGEDDD